MGDGLVLLGAYFQDCRSMIFALSNANFLFFSLFSLKRTCKLSLDNSFMLGYIVYAYMLNRAALFLLLILKNLETLL